MTPMQRTYAIAREATDAQQDVIKELQLEIASLTRGNETLHKLIDEQLTEIANLKAGGCARNQGSTQFCAEAVEVGEKLGTMQRHVELCRQIVKCPDDETLAEWLKGFIRIDDPVVTGLVDVLVLVESHGRNHGSDPLTGEACGCESCENYFAINKALSAYEARVKEVGK